MPITISIPQSPNGAWFGPGASYTAQSDFQGPLPGDTEWHLNIRLPTTEEITWTEILFDQNHTVTSAFQAHDRPKSSTRELNQPLEGTSVQLEVQLVTSSGVIDSGTTTATWNTTRGLGAQSFLSSQATVQGGFTAQDRALLQTTESRTSLLGEAGQLVVSTASGLIPFTLADLFSRTSLDRLILEEMTSGPTCEPVRVVLAPIAQFGVVVRVTTVPDDIQFRTPDGEWSFVDLAVLRIFRGQDLLYRRGIHEISFETDAPWSWGANILDKNLLGVPPPQTQIAVDWRVGCCGQVFLRHLP